MRSWRSWHWPFTALSLFIFCFTAIRSWHNITQFFYSKSWLTLHYFSAVISWLKHSFKTLFEIMTSTLFFCREIMTLIYTVILLWDHDLRTLFYYCFEIMTNTLFYFSDIITNTVFFLLQWDHEAHHPRVLPGHALHGRYLHPSAGQSPHRPHPRHLPGEPQSSGQRGSHGTEHTLSHPLHTLKQ